MGAAGGGGPGPWPDLLPDLAWFLMAYFHQDCDLDDPGPAEVPRHVGATAPLPTVVAVIGQASVLAAADMEPDELGRTLEDLGAGWIRRDDPTGWLDAIVREMAAGAAARLSDEDD